MKTSMKIFVLFIMMNSANALMPARVNAQTSVSFQVFYNDLSPYGNWVNYPDYGYVWIPDYGPDFMPYSSNGYWVYTDLGWTWVSNYPWGWAPFHYGRWSYDPSYGWFWIPDNVWGPAWVTWRTGPDYYGWAPLGPHITYNITYNPPASQWIFVNNYYMGRDDIYHHYHPRTNNINYINNSTVINNTHVNNKGNTTFHAGPKKEDVEKARGIKLKPVTIKEGTQKGQSLKNDQLTLYRPEITKGGKPEKVADLKEVKPVNDRNAVNKAEKKPSVGIREDGMKKKGTIEQPAVKQKSIKQEHSTMPVPKANPNKKAEQGPPINYEKQRQKQEPKPIQPKMNGNKNIPSPPKPVQQPKMEQPKMNPNRNPVMQPQHNPGNGHGKPR